MVVYLNLRVWGPSWYDDLDRLKDRYSRDYYVLSRVVQVKSKQKDCKLHIPVFQTAFLVNNWFMYLHGSVLEPGEDAIVIDEAFATKHGIVLV